MEARRTPRRRGLWPALLGAALVCAALAPPRASADGASRSPLGADGAISLDAALAKPKALPKDVLGEAAAKIMEKYLAAPLQHEYALAQLSPGSGGLVAPNGVLLNAHYVEYLARTLGTLRFRVGRDTDPAVVLVDGKAVGLLMPMKRL